MGTDSKMPWIAIDGCMGAGKSTLANLIARTLHIKFEEEQADKNPFLQDFYATHEETALQTAAQKEIALQAELGFVAIHYRQIATVIQKRQEPIVSDFTLAKDLLFARVNLQEENLVRFQLVYDHFAALTSPPTLLVTLDAPDNVLWSRVMARDRQYERRMKYDYLQRVNRAYKDLPGVCGAAKLLRLRSDEFNVVDEERDRERIVTEIAQAAGIKG